MPFVYAALGGGDAAAGNSAGATCNVTAAAGIATATHRYRRAAQVVAPAVRLAGRHSRACRTRASSLRQHREQPALTAAGAADDDENDDDALQGDARGVPRPARHVLPTATGSYRGGEALVARNLSFAWDDAGQRRRARRIRQRLRTRQSGGDDDGDDASVSDYARSSPLSPSSPASTTAAAAATVDNVSIKVPPGRVHMLLGRNGSGKSTLLQLLGDLLVPDACIELRVPQPCGYVFQNPDVQVLMPTVGGDIACSLPDHLFAPDFDYRTNAGQEALHEHVFAALRDVGFRPHPERMVNRLVQNLSGGEKQRVVTASVLATQPRCLLFDEATANVDVQNRAALAQNVRRYARRHRVPVLWITHLFEEVAYADAVWIMERGRVRKAITRRKFRAERVDGGDGGGPCNNEKNSEAALTESDERERQLRRHDRRRRRLRREHKEEEGDRMVREVTRLLQRPRRQSRPPVS